MISLFLMAAMAAAEPQETAESLSHLQADLAQLRRVLPASPDWDAWLEKTGEMPPDFAALPDWPFPPSPLAAALERLQREDYNRFGPENQRVVIDWLRRR